MKTIKNPLNLDKPSPIQSVLRQLASQEGCDGAPYDQMMNAADYIDELESKLELEQESTWSQQQSPST